MIACPFFLRACTHLFIFGGQGRIRTFVLKREQIYSLHNVMRKLNFLLLYLKIKFFFH